MKEKKYNSILTCYLLNSAWKVAYLPQALKVPWYEKQELRQRDSFNLTV